VYNVGVMDNEKLITRANKVTYLAWKKLYFLFYFYYYLPLSLPILFLFIYLFFVYLL
jgi:hypothetical protein